MATGGVFPRTALILQRLLPSADITIVDANRANFEQARQLLNGGAARIEFVHALYPQPGSVPYDLLVIPLSFSGDRDAIYRQPPAPVVLVHDWIWRKRGTSRIVSI